MSDRKPNFLNFYESKYIEYSKQNHWLNTETNVFTETYDFEVSFF
jgi:hypothetical protein